MDIPVAWSFALQLLFLWFLSWSYQKKLTIILAKQAFYDWQNVADCFFRNLIIIFQTKSIVYKPFLFYHSFMNKNGASHCGYVWNSLHMESHKISDLFMWESPIGSKSRSKLPGQKKSDEIYDHEKNLSSYVCIVYWFETFQFHILSCLKLRRNSFFYVDWECMFCSLPPCHQQSRISLVLDGWLSSSSSVSLEFFIVVRSNHHLC